MPHFINDTCDGCNICSIKCPTGAITGIKREKYVIHPDLCIDCHVCGWWCHVSCIQDETGSFIQYYKPKEIPRAKVIPELCTACDFCVAACPFDCITLEPLSPEDQSPVAVVNEKKCVGCRLCEEVCIKDAIYVPLEHLMVAPAAAA